jgi:hypothetical protein
VGFAFGAAQFPNHAGQVAFPSPDVKSVSQLPEMRALHGNPPFLSTGQSVADTRSPTARFLGLSRFSEVSALGSIHLLKLIGLSTTLSGPSGTEKTRPFLEAMLRTHSVCFHFGISGFHSDILTT